jgi:hypothetical protein
MYGSLERVSCTAFLNSAIDEDLLSSLQTETVQDGLELGYGFCIIKETTSAARGRDIQGW